MTKTLALLLIAFLAACRGEAEVRYSGDGTAPELVTLETNASVMVVANADEPVFYTENAYYLYRGDRWYRSNSHRGGWARIDTPPEHILRIEQPRAYVHYRRGATAPRTTFNQSEQAPPPPPAAPLSEPGQPNDPNSPPREPNSQGPNPPIANPPPPQQVPPSPDSSPTLQGPRDPRNPQQVPPVPPVTPDTRPNSQIAPDPDRAPTSPGMENRSRDQRPATDPDKKPDGKN